MILDKHWSGRKTEWIESIGSGIKHYLDWRDNVFFGHDCPELLYQVSDWRQKSRWYNSKDWQNLIEARKSRRLPNTDLASEDSEDAITWSVLGFLRYLKCWEPFRLFGLNPARELEITFWPRNPCLKDHLSAAYRSAQPKLEPFHDWRNMSEVDVICSDGTNLSLIESKWKSKTFSGQSPNSKHTKEILSNLQNHCEGYFVRGMSMGKACNMGCYQTVRHLAYARQLCRDLPVEEFRVTLLVREGEKNKTEEVRRQVFREATPLNIVTWEELVDNIPPDVISIAKAPDHSFHKGCLFRDYLCTRRCNGQRNPLL